MGKVYGYCRTAQARNIEEQMELVSNYCNKNGLDLAVCYCDDGMSAHSTHKKKLDELLAVIEKGDIIVTKNRSRFMRNPITQQVFVDDLNARGIEVVYADEKERDDVIGIQAWIEKKFAR